MTEKFDVVVVGSGPTGSSAARKCTAGGLKTLLVDKHKLPRRKACSGIICNVTQNYILENFGPLPAGVFGKPNISRGMGFYFPSLGMLYRDTDCYNLYVWRDKFDHFLAQSSGADLRDETRFLNFTDHGHEVEVLLENKQKQEFKVQAKYLIGADGGNSHVLRKLAPQAYAGLPWAFACQKYYEGEIDADDRYLHYFLAGDMGPFPWLNMKDGQLIIGIAVIVGERFNLKFERFLAFLKKTLGLKIKRELAVEGCIANLMTPYNRFFPGRGRVLLAGDALGVMHQGGEGMSCGVYTGGYAGQAVHQAIKTGQDPLPHYKKLIRPELETSLDQFNPLRFNKSLASGTANQPGWFAQYATAEKVMAAKDILKFLKNDFLLPGMGSIILKNSLHRLLYGKYFIPAVD